MFFTVGAEHCHCRALTAIGRVQVTHRRLNGLMTHQFPDANQEELEFYLRQQVAGATADWELRATTGKTDEIPKAGGGKRKLGIPTALDRFIQQALLG